MNSLLFIYLFNYLCILFFLFFYSLKLLYLSFVCMIYKLLKFFYHLVTSRGARWLMCSKLACKLLHEAEMFWAIIKWSPLTRLFVLKAKKSSNSSFLSKARNISLRHQPVQGKTKLWLKSILLYYLRMIIFLFRFCPKWAGAIAS